MDKVHTLLWTSGRTVQGDYSGFKGNFSLRLGVKIWETMVLHGRQVNSVFGDRKKRFEGRIAGTMDTYMDTNEKEASYGSL